jgi:hypothetical protein
MNGLKDLPDWFGTAVVGVVSALAGYAWKSWSNWRRQRVQKRARIIAHLQQLNILLDTSNKLVYGIQRTRADRLLELLARNHPAEYAQGEGREEKMEKCYSVFSDEERVLHGIIRAYSQYSIRRVNEAISEWLKKDRLFKMAMIDGVWREQLAGRLRSLEIHLLLWHSKYEYWIPNSPQHALVYLADEKNHGLGFPPGTDDLVKASLIDLEFRWRRTSFKSMLFRVRLWLRALIPFRKRDETQI